LHDIKGPHLDFFEAAPTAFHTALLLVTISRLFVK